MTLRAARVAYRTMATRKKTDYVTRDEFRAQGILFERLESKMDAMLEGLSSFREQTSREIQELEKRLTARIEVLEQVVRKNSEDIRKNSEDIRKNSDAIHRIEVQLAEIRGRLDRKEEALTSIERRVEALERHMGVH